MGKKRNPGCQCCAGCPIFSDDFNRADSGTIGNGWTENAGTWEILSNELKTTSANGRVSNSPTTPTSLAGIRFSGVMKGMDSGDKLRLHFGAANTYLELTVGGTASLVMVVGGTTIRTCTVTAAEDVYHELIVFVCGRYQQAGGTDNSPTGYVYLNGTLVMWGDGIPTYSYTTAAANSGFGTGSALTAAAYFDDYSVAMFENVNERQSISRSAGTLTSGTWDLTFSGQTAAGIAYNANAAAVQSALEALSNIAPGDVAVTGTPFAPYVVTFQGAYAGIDVPLMTADGANLVGTGTTLSVAETAKGYTCPACAECHFFPTAKTSSWGSVNLVIAGATNFLATNCAGLNGTYTLDKMDNADCAVSGSPCVDGCQCYGLDGLSITIATGVTITSMRFCDGRLRLITSGGTRVLVSFGLTAAANDKYPLCGDGSSIQATEAGNLITNASLDCFSWTFTVSNGG